MKKDKRKVDSYIFLPCILNDINKISSLNHGEDKYDMIKNLKLTSNYEINPDLNLNLDRVYLEEIEISYYPIFDEEKKEKMTETAQIFLTYQKSNKIGVIIICIPDFKGELTNFYDDITKEKSHVNDESSIMNYLSKKYLISKSGSFHSLTFSDKGFDLKYMCSLLSNEAYLTTVNSEIVGKELEVVATNNVELYDFQELYAYDTSLVAILKNFSPSFPERVFNEVQTIFIVEMVLLQNAVLIRNNKEVIKKIENAKSLSMKQIKEITFQFAKAIKLWDFKLYKYPITRRMANIIYKAFNIDKVYEVYANNQTFLEHLINIHSVIVNERESKILNVILIILAATQAAPIIYAAYQNVNANTFLLTDYVLAITIPFITLIIILIFINKNKKRMK